METLNDNEEAIRALMGRFESAFNSANIDAIMKNYVQDESFVIFDVVPRREYRGADIYRNFWVDMFSHFKGKPRIKITDLTITVEGSVGYGYSFQRVVGTDMNGMAVDRKVRVTDGYRKIGNNWLIALEHVSVPVDLKTGTAGLTSK